MLVLCVELIHSTALVSQLKALARPNAVEALKEWASRSHLMALTMTTTQGSLDASFVHAFLTLLCLLDTI